MIPKRRSTPQPTIYDVLKNKTYAIDKKLLKDLQTGTKDHFMLTSFLPADDYDDITASLVIETPIEPATNPLEAAWNKEYRNQQEIG